MRKAFFGPTDLHQKREDCMFQITKFSNKNDHVCAWRDFNSTSCVLSRPVRTDKSSIFNFEYVNEV